MCVLSLRHWADAYNGVWGTTEALKAQFYSAVCECMDQNRRVKIIQAQVDKITSLKEYKDRAFSHFLFYVVRRPSRCRACPRAPNFCTNPPPTLSERRAEGHRYRAEAARDPQKYPAAGSAAA